MVQMVHDELAQWKNTAVSQKLLSEVYTITI